METLNINADIILQLKLSRNENKAKDILKAYHERIQYARVKERLNLNYARAKHKRAYFKELGLCCSCGKVPSEKYRCQRCAEIHRRSDKNRVVQK